MEDTPMHVKSLAVRKYWWITLLCLVGGLALGLVPVGAAQAQDGGDGEEPRSPDECANCHPDEYEVWQASQHANALADPDFIQAWERAGSPAYCKSCHATGYDAVEGTVAYEGVGCLACHQDAEGNHPGTDMTVDKSSELCGTCHTGTHAPDYDQWLVSDHATMNIGCTDCHQSHNTALHFDNPTELCVSCHQGLDEDTHGVQGMACHDCHMAAGDEVVDQFSGATNGPGHSFAITPGVCQKCHGMTHSLAPDGTLLTMSQTAPDDSAQTQEDADRANQQLNLGLTGGGISGLIIGIAVPWLLHRRAQK